MISIQRRKFPFPIGVIMLPLLIVSAFGIIVFSFNIFFIDYQKKNSAAAADLLLPNLNLEAAKAEAAKKPEVKKTETKKTETKKTEVKKPEVKKTDNIQLAIPVGVSQPMLPAVTKTEPVNQARSNNDVKPAPVREQNNTARIEPSRNVSPNSNIKVQEWTIQAGAFSIESSATKVKDKIVQLGYEARVIKTGTDKPLFRVMVSPGSSRSAPNDALKRLNANGIEGYIVMSGRP